MENSFKNIIFKKMAFMVIFFYTFVCSAQTDSLRPIFIFDQSVTVLNSSSDTMNRAWSGAFRSPQFSEIDYNNDGVKDVFVFDRYDNTISVFVYDAGEYIYQPNADFLFPSFQYWVLLRDYNCDGKNDIFAASLNGVQVWENTTTGSGKLSFSLVSNALITTNNGPLMVLAGDIPSISDIDNDGDLDILAFGNTGVYVTYFINRSMDNNGICDLDYELHTQCWGHFREGGTSSSIVLGDDCGGNRPAQLIDSTQNGVMHTGSTLTAYDSDGDGDKELLVGDITSNHIKSLKNGKDINESIITSVIDLFPTNHPVNMYVYNAAFLIDTDKDGDKDLIIAPADGNESGGKNNNQNIYYENTGTSTIPNFQFVKNNFITDKAIEVGGGAAPKLYDFDFDGDLDLFIGNFAFRETPIYVQSKVLLYENIGDSTSATFRLLDSNFANLQTTNTNLFSKVIEFADLDNDGDDDMLIGSFNGKLRYYVNSAGANQIGVYSLFSDFNGPNYQGIDVGNNAAPELIDFDRDGDFDLIVGEANGNLNYFENIGTPSNANFNIVSDSLGSINLKGTFVGGHSTPTITDLNGNNNYDLVVGSYDGFVFVYMDIEDYPNLEDNYLAEDSTYFNNVSEYFTNIQFGRRVIPTLGDLDNDGFPEMLVGTYRGGVHFLKNTSDSNIIGKPNTIIENNFKDIFVYPNPSKGKFRINISSVKSNYSIVVLNSVGQICSFDIKSTETEVSIDMKENANGLYYLIIIDDKGVIYKSKISLLK